MENSIIPGLFASPWNIIRNLFDILIVAYLIFRILKWLRGTRAEQLLKGLAVLVIFSLLISYLNLEMTKWIIEKIWIVFAVALPIVFQPELRRLLEQLGRSTKFGKFAWGSSNLEEVLKEVIAAVKCLKKSKTGALIVFKRSTGINEYLESGCIIDGILSARLLLTIFHTNTSLHDGAVIVNDDRIEKAACFMPLSDNPNLDVNLGTRHRAAIGITELSDAIALVVSEETGNISLAIEGKIERDINLDDLEDKMRQELSGFSFAESFRLRRWQ